MLPCRAAEDQRRTMLHAVLQPDARERRELEANRLKLDTRQLRKQAAIAVWQYEHLPGPVMSRQPCSRQLSLLLFTRIAPITYELCRCDRHLHYQRNSSCVIL